MIKNLTLALLLLIAGATAAIGQIDTTVRPPCNEPWCMDQTFKYKFCTPEGVMVEMCSSDPNNDMSKSPPLRPAKKAIPMCFKLNLSAIARDFQQIVIDPSTAEKPGVNLVVFDIMDVEHLLKKAEMDWTIGTCSQKSPNQEYHNCCVEVRFSKDEADFGQNPVDATRAFVFDPPEGFIGSKGQRYCRVDCDRSEIIINYNPFFTKPFLEGPDKGTPSRFFFTRNLDGLQRLRPDLEYVSLYSILAHEMGHWMGIGHIDATPDSYGKRCKQPENSIMANGYVGQWNQVERQITPADKCAFMKLYCCYNFRDLLDVETGEMAEHEAFDIAPNPLQHDLLTVKLHERASSMRVMNSLGELVLEKPLIGEEQEVAIQAAGWPNGVYFVSVVSHKGTFGRKLVIQR